MRIAPHERGFKVCARDVKTGDESTYTCKYLVYATGQRAKLRQLDVEGEDQPFVTPFYDKPEDFPGDRVMVVGEGARAIGPLQSARCGQAGVYSMRQASEIHWQLINDSLYLPTISGSRTFCGPLLLGWKRFTIRVSKRLVQTGAWR